MICHPKATQFPTKTTVINTIITPRLSKEFRPQKPATGCPSVPQLLNSVHLSKKDKKFHAAISMTCLVDAAMSALRAVVSCRPFRSVTSVHNSLVYLRRNYRTKDGKRHACWTLVQSVRTERGPRQRIVAYLGLSDEAGRPVGVGCGGSGYAPSSGTSF